MQSFHDEAAAQSTHVNRVLCQVGAFLTGLPVAEQEHVAEAIDDLELTAPALAATISNRYGDCVSQGSLERHRRRLTDSVHKCLCPRFDASEVAA